eukprot:1997389-Amphidinium_carterae.1
MDQSKDYKQCHSCAKLLSAALIALGAIRVSQKLMSEWSQIIESAQNQHCEKSEKGQIRESEESENSHREQETQSESEMEW